MTQFAFTAQLTDQHRAELLASAQHARNCRQAKAASARPSLRFTFSRPIRVRTGRTATPRPRLREAL